MLVTPAMLIGCGSQPAAADTEVAEQPADGVVVTSSSDLGRGSVVVWRDPVEGCDYVVVVPGSYRAGFAITPRLRATGKPICEATQ
ncbi:hypothetical protein [Novosphingobium resinovorum]|uniref:hypothetical protein n=1 Tax=Novosphingobium resinovorum TaxID=158500 RepID=UPI0012EA5BCB|nr:hypothetical protein [Novosphingobium resinovorum]